MPISVMREFLKMEAAGGIVLVAAAALAVWLANSAFAPFYQEFLDIRASVRIGALVLDKPLWLWINDGLMAVFFFLVGLEIKRELLIGHLSSRQQAILPLIAAAGGMLVPGLIYAAINAGNGETLNGWAIPAATDIAFALGVLSLLGSRVPVSLKIFLTAVAIFDDLGAIVIIAFFYTDNLSLISLGLAATALAALTTFNILSINRLAPFLVVGAVLWVCVLKSGVHATLAGVALAMAIPLKPKDPQQPSLLLSCEHGLHPWVAFGVLPLFGFANAGVSFTGMTLYSVFQPITLGTALGLFVGKQIGVFSATWLAVRSGVARLPDEATWRQVYGIAVLCGIGFTMSLFIGSLAWDHTNYDAQVRLGVLLGSISAALLGAGVLLLVGRPQPERSEAQPAVSPP